MIAGLEREAQQSAVAKISFRSSQQDSCVAHLVEDRVSPPSAVNDIMAWMTAMKPARLLQSPCSVKMGLPATRHARSSRSSKGMYTQRACSIAGSQSDEMRRHWRDVIPRSEDLEILRGTIDSEGLKAMGLLESVREAEL